MDFECVQFQKISGMPSVAASLRADVQTVQAGLPEEIQVLMQLPVESTVQYMSVHNTVQHSLHIHKQK